MTESCFQQSVACVQKPCPLQFPPKKLIGVKSGERGGQSIAPRRPVHLLENVNSSSSRTMRANEAGSHLAENRTCILIKPND